MNRYFIILLLFLFSVYIKAQEKQYLFANIDKSQGLSNNHPLVFLKDHKGFLWVGTIEGLCRYDGYSFKVFKNNPKDSTSIRDNFITNLFEDHKGNIWIAAGDYFEKFNTETESFDHNQSLFNGRIKIPEKSKWFHKYLPDENIIYLNTFTGLFKYNINTDSVHTIQFPWVKLATDMQTDSEGNLWIACSNAIIYKLDYKNYSICDSIKLTKTIDNKYHLFIDKDKDIWIYDRNNSLGATYYNAQMKTLEHFTTNSKKLPLSNNYVSGFIQDEKGQIWIGTDHGGLNIVNKSDFSVQYVKNDPSNNRSLCENSIKNLYKDKEGFIWLGSFKRGFSYYHKNLYSFDLHKINIAGSFIKGANDIDNFIEDKEGNFWIGTNGGGLIFYDKKKKKYRQYLHDPNDPGSISANVIIGMLLDSKNRLWIGTYFGGLNLFNGKNFEHFTTNPNITTSISDDRIWDICEDKDGKLWITTLLGGVNVFDPETKKVIKVYRGMSDNSIRSNVVFSVFEGKNDLMWFATIDGLKSLDNKTGKFTHYIHNDSIPGSLSKNHVIDVIEDSRGLIWAATADGLNLLDKKTGKFKIFKEADGLPTNYIVSLLEDSNNNLWMSTSNGLSNLIITKDDNSDKYLFNFKNYDYSDGLQSNEFNEKAALKTSSGELLFGGPNGFNVFNPDKVKFFNSRSEIVFTDFQINNNSISNKTPYNNRYILKKAITHTDSIVLKSNENVFTIEFSDLNYIHPERRQYKYMLENFNNEWYLASSNERRITYTNLNPGIYIFRVKSTNNDGTWSDKEIKLHITILPHWSGSLLFKISITLLLATLMVIFYYFRVNSFKKQQKYLEQKVEERTTELRKTNNLLEKRQKKILDQNTELETHRNNLERLVKERTIELEDAMRKAMESDKLKSAFLANLSHEIRTPMNAIVGLSHLVDDPELSPCERKELVNLINSNSETLLYLIEDILDISLIEANQLALSKSAFYLNDVINKVYTAFKLNNNNKELQIVLNNALEDKNLKLNSDQKRIEQIISNLMSNACKFTESGAIELGVMKSNSDLCIYVKDTGIGIAKNELRYIFERFRKSTNASDSKFRGVGLGLSISKKLAILLNGNLYAQSDPQRGSVFTLKLPYQDIITTKKINHFASVSPKKLQNGQKSILIVEDEETNYYYLVKALKKTKAEIFWAQDGFQALTHFKEGKKFDLVLMDIKLPVMDGFEASKKIKEIHPGQAIIAQTAYARPEDKTYIKNAGFNDYIAKPIKPQDLINIIKKYI